MENGDRVSVTDGFFKGRKAVIQRRAQPEELTYNAADEDEIAYVVNITDSPLSGYFTEGIILLERQMQKSSPRDINMIVMAICVEDMWTVHVMGMPGLQAEAGSLQDAIERLEAKVGREATEVRVRN